MYLDKGADEFERQTITKNRLDKDPKGKDVSPHHDALAPPSPTQPQRLPPDLLLLLSHAVELALLLLLAALNVLVLPRGPLLLAALLKELGAVLLEGSDGKERELVVLGDLNGGAGHHHGCEGLVAVEEVLARQGGYHDEVSL